MVRNGKDRQRPLAEALSRPVNTGGLHLHRQNTELPVGGVGLRIVIIELVGGEHLSHVRPDAQPFRRCGSVLQKAVVRRGAKLAGEPVLVGKVGIGGGAHSQHHVPHLHILSDAPGGADADDGVHAVEVIQLVGVQSRRGNAHAVTHDGQFPTLIGADIAQHIPHGIEAHRVFQIVLRYEFRPQRVAGHQYRLGDDALLRCDAGRGRF